MAISGLQTRAVGINSSTIENPMKPIKLSELINALEFDSEEQVSCVDLQNGCVVTVEQSLLSALQEGDDEALHDLPDWQKEEIEVARRMVEDEDERFVLLPEKFDFHEYRQMERFIGTVENAEIAEQLWRSIKGKGAFRYFKDTAGRLGLLQRWYQYRDDAMKEFVIDWAEAHNVPYEDDIKPGKH
jgi:hypothetical protein